VTTPPVGRGVCRSWLCVDLDTFSDADESHVHGHPAMLNGFWTGATSSPWLIAGLMLALAVFGVRLIHAFAYPRNRRDPVRLFSRHDKAIIVARACGRCEHYGWLTGRCKRTERLEADHVHPHSRGGQTAVANGQALCRPHNQAKRANIPFNWQLRAIERHRATYFPLGVPGTVTRRAARSRQSRRPPSQSSHDRFN
jgi:hypothetical protein